MNMAVKVARCGLITLDSFKPRVARVEHGFNLRRKKFHGWLEAQNTVQFVDF